MTAATMAIPVPTTHLTSRSSRAFRHASSVSWVTWSPCSAARAMALAMTSAWSRLTPPAVNSRATSSVSNVLGSVPRLRSNRSTEGRPRCPHRDRRPPPRIHSRGPLRRSGLPSPASRARPGERTAQGAHHGSDVGRHVEVALPRGAHDVGSDHVTPDMVFLESSRAHSAGRRGAR